MHDAIDDLVPSARATSGLAGRALPALLLAAAAVLAPAEAAEAQEAPTCNFRSPASELTERASPPDSSSMELAGGTVKICYGSPKVRGREIFGGLVPWDQPWRLGANEPTTLHTTVPLRIGDVRVEPGSYSLYTVPHEEKGWELVVNAATDRWGIPIDEGVMEHDIGSTTAVPSSADRSAESLRIRLERTGEREGRMSIAWATTRVEVPLSAAEADSGGGG